MGGLEESALKLLLVAVLVVAVLFAFTAVVWRWERRLVWPYAPQTLPNGDPRDPAFRATVVVTPEPAAGGSRVLLSPRVVRVGVDAHGFGFDWLGLFRDAKGPLYKVLYEFWYSKDRSVLLILGAGSVAGVQLEGSWLYSPLPDGRMIATIDNLAASAGDESGLLTETFLATSSFEQLLAHHERRRDAAGGRGLAFGGTDPIAALRDFRLRVASNLERRGKLQFVSADRQAWRYTWAGAASGAGKALLRNVKRTLSPGSYVAGKGRS